MNPDSCPICHSVDLRLVFDDVRDYITGNSFQVRRCNNCDVGFTYPYSQQMEPYYPPQYRRYRFPVSVLLRALYSLRAKSWSKLCGKPGTVLEIGCGDGVMLDTLRRLGWRVVGVERTAKMAWFACHKLGLPVFAGGTEAIVPKPHFDLIILFQVLEHISDPLNVLKQCATLLKPGGVLLVGMPNLDSWQALYSGPHWFHLDVPRHLFHFSPKSLENVLEMADLMLAHISFISFEHDPYGWVQSTLNRIGAGSRGQANALTRRLMGLDQFAWKDLTMVLVGALMLIPSLLLSLLSWARGSGAIMVATAFREPEDKTR